MSSITPGAITESHMCVPSFGGVDAFEQFRINKQHLLTNRQFAMLCGCNGHQIHVCGFHFLYLDKSQYTSLSGTPTHTLLTITKQTIYCTYNVFSLSLSKHDSSYVCNHPGLDP